MKVDIPKEWSMKMATLEGDAEIGVGCSLPHEEWESRMQRGTFKFRDWARDLRRDIEAYRVAAQAVRKEVDDNEGDDPMSNDYKRLDLALSHAGGNVHRHLNHGVLLAVSDLVAMLGDQEEVDWSVVREAIEDTADEYGSGSPLALQVSFQAHGLLVAHEPDPSTETPTV